MKLFTLLALFLSLNVPAQAVELRGDWESAGDMPLPYNPGYSFEYDCQLEMKGEGQFVAVTGFKLNNQTTYLETGKSTEWQWVKLGGERPETLPKAPKSHGLQLGGFSSSLDFDPANSPDQDGVTLSLGWKIDTKGQKISGKNYNFHFQRQSQRLQGELAFSFRTGKKYSPLTIQVHCYKVK